MRLQWTDGSRLYCRRCDTEVPHYEWRNPYELAEGLRDQEGHVQHPLNAVISLSVEQEVSPAVMLLPRRSWTAPYVEARYALLHLYKNRNSGGG
jgi:hypothetical protein